ncbi:ligand-binding sensor domain-containing protein [Cellulophaga lytica]|uniref:ligand-binding sensor domain-containing protein n=1 Tax=Cellulophaga lytica TaxID=979 RepID=UPI0032E39816
MNIKIELIYLLFILTLNLSCAENKKSDKETDNSEFVRISENDTLKLTSGIRAILQDSKGNYWLGSHNEGVSVYDGKLFKYITTNDGLPNNQIRSIQEDENGIIWIVTANGVCSYDGLKITNYPTEIGNPELDWNLTKGNLWFYAGEEDGINRFDGKEMYSLIFPKPKNINPNNSFGVTGISKDKNEKLWIATYSALFSYDGKKVDIYEGKKLNLKNDELIHIRSVLADSKGRIWIGNNGIGLILINGERITHFSKEQGKLIPLNEFEANIKSQQLDKNTGLQSVFAIEEDSEGNIWFGDRDSGAWKYDGKTLTNFTIDSALSKSMIWTIYNDNSNNLLFGMANGGVYRLNGKSFEKMF